MIKLWDLILSPLREVTAIQDQVERYQVAFIEPNGCNFDISADESVTHCGMRPSHIWPKTVISRLPLWASIFDILLFSMDYDIATASDSYSFMLPIVAKYFAH
jgi:hypothetical protein